ncbi:phosphotransferase [Amycolatopsis sp. CA-128772]|uniref:phosphotransferase n=1 Tax=Amycolatopsis sp. CA-128772 TaxID=2073159 RepID=UPI001E2BA4C7|nr:phosphotransferase [Amycolatopsis sp. CA-128772]
MPDLPRPERITVDAGQVRRLVLDQFPHWADRPVRPVARGGWDNFTFHLGDDLVARLPSAAGYALAVGKEQRWLPRLAPRLPRPVPGPVAVGRPGAGYPFRGRVPDRRRRGVIGCAMGWPRAEYPGEGGAG